MIAKLVNLVMKANADRAKINRPKKAQKAQKAQKAKKAQISLELLILIAVFFAFLSVWISSISNVWIGTNDILSNLYKERALTHIIDSSDEICILGEGNKRELRLHFLTPTTITAEDNKITVDDNNGKGEISGNTKCEFNTESENLSSNENGDIFITIENDGGKIIIRS